VLDIDTGEITLDGDALGTVTISVEDFALCEEPMGRDQRAAEWVARWLR